MKIIRDGAELTLTGTIGELPSEPQAAAAPAAVSNSLRGVSVQELTDDYLRKMNITKKLKGVVVTGVEPDSPAQGVLASGDIILELNRKLITNLKDYQAVLAGIDRTQDILVLIVRGAVSQYITIPGKEK